MIVTLTSYKGGVGKTTSAIHIAAYLAKQAPTALIDGDPNRSATHWGQRGNLPFKVIDLLQAPRYSKDFQHLVIDTAARPSKDDLQALAEGCDRLIIPSSPDALALDAMLQTIEGLQAIGSQNYHILFTMVHSDKQTAMAREALENQPILKHEVRRLIAFEKSALMGVPVYDVKGDRMAKNGWRDYVAVCEELLS